ncbi:MAG: ABC transporter ATP-binding protein [Pyrinomonadaceae bacterium]|nr:ABC transporter ATP-binding protein [Pyrinomonadaceae bacterium]
MPSLVVRDLRKAYSSPAGARIEVLRGASFAVESGQMVAVVGVSGAGKSTLLNLLGGLDAADSGAARLDDFEITRAGGGALARFRVRDVGFVFQFHRLLGDLTAVENVALPLLVARRKNAEAMREAFSMLERVGLRERAAHLAGELSGGEAGRVAIARALVHAPRLVLADEPTGNLDQKTGDETGELLRALCSERQTITIVATHNERLAHLCHRVFRLQDGRLEEV